MLVSNSRMDDLSRVGMEDLRLLESFYLMRESLYFLTLGPLKYEFSNSFLAIWSLEILFFLDKLELMSRLIMGLMALWWVEVKGLSLIFSTADTVYYLFPCLLLDPSFIFLISCY